LTFSLEEAAPDDMQDAVLVADRCGGAPLASEEGPFRIIAPGSRHNRSARQVVRIVVRDAAP
jgi:hypothetical protein